MLAEIMNPDLFSPEFKATSIYEELPRLVRKSPLLKQCMEDLEAKGGMVFLSRPGTGTYCNGKDVFIDASRIDCQANEHIASSLTHEMQHSRAREMCDVLVSAARTVEEFKSAYADDEGKAVTAGYLCALELGYTQKGGMYDDLVGCPSQEAMEEKAGNLCLGRTPSGNINITYEKLYEIWFGRSAANLRIEQNAFDNIKPGQFSVTTLPDGGFEVEIPEGSDLIVREGRDKLKVIHHLKARFNADREEIGERIEVSSPLSKEEAQVKIQAILAERAAKEGRGPSHKGYGGALTEELKSHPFGEKVLELMEKSPTLKKCITDLEWNKGQIFLHEPGPDAKRRDIYFTGDELKNLSGDQFVLELASRLDASRRYLPPRQDCLRSREYSLDKLAYAACTEFRVSSELGIPMRDPVLQKQLEKSKGHRTEVAKEYVSNIPSTVAPKLTRLEVNYLLAAMENVHLDLAPETWKALEPGQIHLRKYPDGGFDLSIPATIPVLDKQGTPPKEIQGYEGSFAVDGQSREKPGIWAQIEQANEEQMRKMEVKLTWLKDKALDKLDIATDAVREHVKRTDHGLISLFGDNPHLSDIAADYQEEVAGANEKHDLALEMKTSPAQAEKTRLSSIQEAQEQAKASIKTRLENGAPELEAKRGPVPTEECAVVQKGI